MDIALYRRNETLARQFQPSWRVAHAYKPHVLKTSGFPLQVESTADLVPLLNGMHEGGFGGFLSFQKELGGLTDPDAQLLASMLAEFAMFAERNFHFPRVELPLDAFMAHYALYTKLCGLFPERSYSVLEIDPGCGYLSFFLRAAEAEYASVETTESFYMLQTLVNEFCYPSSVLEHAAVCGHFEVHAPLRSAESPVAIYVQNYANCQHYPWWRAGMLVGSHFDVVTSNANLTAFSDAAFIEYAGLIQDVLKPEGALVMQDFGGGGIAALDQRLHYLHSIGFAALVLVEARPNADKWFATPNAVFVRDGHPQFEELHQRGVVTYSFPTDDPIVRRMFRLDDIGPRKIYERYELAEIVDNVLGN